MQKFLFSLLVVITSCTANAPAQSYDEFKANILKTREVIQQSYMAADSSGKDSIITYSQVFLRNMSQEIFTYWYNTEWDFNGITQKPKTGKIACGYFVTTVIRDLGFNIPRSTWAQLASETMIKKLNPSVKKYSNKSIEVVIDYFKNRPDGIYIVGLDTHVGFVSKEGKQIKFIHSSYYKPKIGVMSESLKGNNPINDASYRVIGQIFHYEMTKKWILNEKYE
ncbi:MAG TPA: hypothetical protein VGC65_06585 [Bacteroidia bacterium]|jgi:hypothetical protein